MQNLTNLKVEKNEFNYENLLTFDTETSDGLRGTELRKIALSWKEGEKREYEIFDEISPFIKLLNYHNAKEKKIYAHSLEFDLRFLLKEAKLKRFLIYQKGILSSDLIFKNYTNVFSFRDSSAILPLKQSHLAKAFDSRGKYEIDFTKKVSNSDIEKRVKDDVLGLIEILEKANKFYYDKFSLNILKRLTMSKFGLDIFRTEKFLKHTLENPYVYQNNYNWKLYDFVRNSYYGAIVTPFKLNLFHNVKSYDINGMYSSVMKDKNYPCGKMRIIRFPKKEVLNDFGFSDVKLEVYQNDFISPIPIKIGLSTYYVTGKIEGIYSHEQLDYLTKNNLGKILEINKSYVFNDANKIFKPFIDFTYKMRRDFQIAKNPFEQAIKLLMVSSYGKFAQKPEKYKYEQLTNIEEFFESEELYYLGNDVYCKIAEKKLYVFSLIHLSSYITSYSKNMQLDYLLKYYEDVIYTDTDSFVLPSRTNVYTGTRLGELKQEKSFDKFQAFSPKAFLYENKLISGVTLKGFYYDRKKIEKMTFEQILTLLRNGVKWQKYASVKRMLNPNKNTVFVDDYLAYEDRERHFPLTFTKRKIMQNGKTRPFDIKELIV